MYALRTVFDEQNVVSTRDIRYRAEIEPHAKQMRDEDRSRPVGDRAASISCGSGASVFGSTSTGTTTKPLSSIIRPHFGDRDR